MVRRKRISWLGGVLASICLAGVGQQAAAESANVSVPASIIFNVINVSQATTGSPNPTLLSFDTAVLTGSNRLRASVAPTTASFTTPPGGGAAIPASRVSWNAGSTVNGVGSNGALTFGAYVQVFRSTPHKTNGSVDIVWTLAAPGGAVRAGNHTLTIQWKFESL